MGVCVSVCVSVCVGMWAHLSLSRSLSLSTSFGPVLAGADSEEKRTEWVEKLRGCVGGECESSTENDAQSDQPERAPTKKLSAKLCSLVHYTQSVRFLGFEHPHATSTAAFMSSFSEKKVSKLVHKASGRLAAFAQRHFVRVYPSYHRVKSANFDPQVHWNYGCQLVALNWQTPCEEMWLNRHFFARNGLIQKRGRGQEASQCR